MLRSGLGRDEPPDFRRKRRGRADLLRDRLRGRSGRPARRERRGRTGHQAIDDPHETRQIAERLARVGELEPRAAAVALGERVVDEALVLGARGDGVAGVRVGGGEAAVRREVAGGDRRGLGEERDRAGTVALPREARRAIAEREQRRWDVLERDLRQGEPAERLGIAVLLGELAVRLFGLTELAVRVELGRGVEREARRAAVADLGIARGVDHGRGLDDSARETGDPVAELGGALAVHDLARGEPCTLTQRRQVERRDGVGRTFERAQLLREELRGRRAEVLLRDLEHLLAEGVHSSPASSAKA